MVKASQTVLAYTKAPVSSADTEITIRGLQDIYGIQAVMQGTTMYGTIEPRSSTNQEIISFTNIVVVDANTVRLTGCTRGLKAQDSETGTERDHGANVEFILSNNPQFYDTFAALDEEETITEEWTFNVSPIVPTPTTGQQAVNKDFAEGLANQGAADASTTTKGISRLSESPTTTLGTATVTIASPAVVTLASHGLTANDTIEFTTTGALPTGLLPSVTYYVISAGLTSSEFRLALTLGGTAINTTGSQSGTHTLYKTTPVAVGVNDTKMLTQDLRNAANGAGGSPSSTNLFETQYDTSNGSTKTATTISFAAGTKTIADSGNGFVTAGFKQGTQITVTGSASNNGTYTIVSVAAGAIVIAETLVNESAGASVTITSVTADKIVRRDSNGVIPGLPSQAFFGDGSDGDVTISSNTSLTRDMYYNNLTIQNTFTLSPKGFRIFVKGTLNCEGTGKIASNGGAGGAGAIGVNTGVPPAGGAAGAADYTGATLPTPKVGVIGAVGGSSSNGITGTAVTLNETMTAAVAGGAGGAGSSGSPGSGGAAGSAGSNPVMRPRTYQSAYNLYDMTGSTITRHEIAPTGGSGGGGGGNGANNIGGGGGGSGSTGGFISIFANIVTSLTVEALGGAGGAGGATNIVNTGGGGGGAGGNGGFILLFYGSKTTVTGTVTGGAAGSGGVATAPATNSGVAGTAGNSGVVLQIQI